MRRQILIVFFGCYAVTSLAANTPSQQPVGKKDSRATAVLTQMVSATGWSPSALPPDALITGALVRHFSTGDVQSGFSVKLRGLGQYRFQNSDSQDALIVNGNAAAAVAADGKSKEGDHHW